MSGEPAMLAWARSVVEDVRLLSPNEYHRAALVVLLEIHDKLDSLLAPPSASSTDEASPATTQDAAPVVAPTQRGRRKG